MPEPDFHDFHDREQLDAALSATVAARLEAALQARGRAVLVVSGGSTPAGFFRRLSEAPLDWPRISVTLADERWVPVTHVDSNERLVREQLLLGPAAAAQFVSLYMPLALPEAAEATIAARLETLGHFDVVVLGMGSDGHTASLFPGSDSLAAGIDEHSTRACLAVHPPFAPHARMSLTRSRLVDSEALFVHITGADKRAVLEQARAKGDPMSLPIAAFLGDLPNPAAVYWAP